MVQILSLPPTFPKAAEVPLRFLTTETDCSGREYPRFLRRYALNLLKECGAKEVLLAGFDGFFCQH